jgi:radical SAM superfamily enzyme YgiQ (UPF0313 family)
MPYAMNPTQKTRPRVLWPVLDLHKGDNLFTGISIISSFLREYGYHSEVIEANHHTLSKALSGNLPTVVAFSTPTIFAQTYMELCKQLKRRHEFFACFGGPHPTYFPEMIEAEGIDGICRGEGEEAMLELLNSLSNGDSIAHIQNWWIKENGTIHKNPIRPLIQDLDELPLPDHEIFRTVIPHSIWQAMVITTRGCPYQCTYCYNHVYKKICEGKGRIVRRRSVDHVIRELQSVKEHKCYRFIRFLDDLFTLTADWIEEFSDRYSKEIGLPFSCLVRANHITPEIVRNLKKAGCWRVQMGLESADDYVRNTIFKRGMKVEEIVTASRLLKDAGIKLVTGNIVGAPGSSFESDMKTLRLNMEIRPDYAGVALLQPYPGTEIHECAKEMGMLPPDSLNLSESTVSRISTLTYRDKREKARIENLQKLFFIPVEFPWLVGVVKLLIRLPSNRFYHFVFSRWVNYCQYFRCIPPSIGWRSILKRSKLYSSLASVFSGQRGHSPRSATAETR